MPIDVIHDPTPELQVQSGHAAQSGSMMVRIGSDQLCDKSLWNHGGTATDLIVYIVCSPSKAVNRTLLSDDNTISYPTPHCRPHWLFKDSLLRFLADPPLLFLSSEKVNNLVSFTPTHTTPTIPLSRHARTGGYHAAQVILSTPRRTRHIEYRVHMS